MPPLHFYGFMETHRIRKSLNPRVQAQTVEKPLADFSDKLWQTAACIICPPVGDKFHTCSLRCVFCQVHAPAENGLDSICRQWRQTLRGFFDKLKA